MPASAQRPAHPSGRQVIMHCSVAATPARPHRQRLPIVSLSAAYLCGQSWYAGRVNVRPSRGVLWVMSPSKITLLARLAVLALVGFVLAVVVAGAVTPGYHVVAEYISALAARTNPHPWIMTAGFVCLAVSTVAAALTLSRRVGGISGAIGCVLLGLAGLALVGAAAFRLDCSPTLASCAAQEVAGQVSGQHVLHNLVSLLSHLLLAIAYLVLARPLRKSPGLARVSRPTLAVGLGLLAFTVALVTADFDPIAGAVQRVAVVVAYGWSVRLAVAAATSARRVINADAMANAR